MRFRLKFRMRTFLITTAVLSIAVAYATTEWREGRFAFQKHHAWRADRLSFEIRGIHNALRVHSQLPRTLAVRRIGELNKRLHEAERERRWHRRVVGPAMDRLTTWQ